MVLWFFPAAVLFAKTPAGFAPYQALQARLVREGFNHNFVRTLYSNPQAVFDSKGITAYFLHRESALDYSRFLSGRPIRQALAYLDDHADELQNARKHYGVSGEIITAILLVESRLGTSVGRHPVFVTLSNMAAVGDEKTRDIVWNTYVKKKASTSKKNFDAWAARKSKWAFDELKAYLTYIQTQGLDAFSMRGSYAGALGFAQFVPSSVLTFGVDGDRDGRVNLYQHRDAIESVANYLQRHGWKPDLNRKEAFRILLRYNNSAYYANTILDVADRLSRAR